eukprot:TRINITY_DN5462_c0_g2_i1.p1 TRINITY_DN5462_c0_g2~~TRINITY_DN5462_c0_g2_i1.p1  ORF type:complete len:911 (+),score=292.49 TRINITY_DN5462_c0_g2_i1:62-2794(+)
MAIVLPLMESSSGAAVVKRTGGDLAALLQQRRDDCVEFESCPGGSTADAASEAASEAALKGAAEAPAAANSAAGKRVKDEDLQGLLERRRNQCQVLENEPAAPSQASAAAQQAKDGGAAATAKLPTGPAATRTGMDLADVLKQRRNDCVEFESMPEGSTADTSAAKKRTSINGAILFESTPGQCQADASATPGDAETAKAADKLPVNTDGAARHKALNTRGDLKRWMRKMKSRCQVISTDGVGEEDLSEEEEGVEFDKEDPFKDVWTGPTTLQPWERKQQQQQQQQPQQQQQGNDAASDDATTALSAKASELEDPAAAVATPAAAEEVAVKDPDGQAATLDFKPPERRPTEAQEAAESQSSCPAATASPSSSSRAPVPPEERNALWAARLAAELRPAVAEAAGYTPPLPGGLSALLSVDGLFGAEPKVPPQQLEAAFARKFLYWSRPTAARGDEVTNLGAFGTIACLLRYHFPAVAAAWEAGPCQGPGAAQDIERLLGEAFPDGLGQLAEQLFASASEEACREAVLFVCDQLVSEGNASLFLIVLAMFFAEADIPEGPSSLQSLKEQLRAKAPLSRLRMPTARRLLELALELAEATPSSVLNPITGGSVKSSGSSSSGCSSAARGVCSVAAEEVLMHVYDKPHTAWRFVVMDIRRKTITAALPLCMRIDAKQDRFEVVRGLPDEACIHLCFVADDSPVPGEEAFELVQGLLRPPDCRKRMSVVAGGWPAVMRAAEAMGFELTPVELEKDGTIKLVSVGSKALKKAGAAVVKNAHKVFTGASNAFKSLGLEAKTKESWFGMGAAQLAREALAAVGGSDRKAGHEYTVALDEGSLGFQLEGAKVTFVDPVGQAAAKGVREGDALVAVAGKRIPPPPKDMEPAEVDKRLKLRIKMWIKDQKRPVHLTFVSAAS